MRLREALAYYCAGLAISSLLLSGALSMWLISTGYFYAPLVFWIVGAVAAVASLILAYAEDGEE